MFTWILAFLPKLGLALAVLVGSWALGVTARQIMERLCRSKRIDAELTRFLGSVAYVTLLSFGVVTALATIGINVSALVAGLGLSGFALGLALKDIISNAISGVLILLYKPFRQGDQVFVTALEGAVVEVNLRYTVLETEDRIIYVPNASLFTNAVIVAKKKPTPETELAPAPEPVPTTMPLG